MAQWLAIAVSIGTGIIATLLSGALFKGYMQASMRAREKFEVEAAAAMRDMAKALADLDKYAAVNTAQHAETSRRMSEFDKQLGAHAEQIRVLRTRAHIAANKLMELDPNWKEYRNAEI